MWLPVLAAGKLLTLNEQRVTSLFANKNHGDFLTRFVHVEQNAVFAEQPQFTLR